MSIPEKYKHINFKPPQGARKEAEKSLAWRREFGRGGTAVGIARARDLANGVELSPSTVRRMKAFFDRHQKNKSAPGWSPDEDGFPSNSRIAWAMWGSDAGWSWAKKVVEQMNAADEKEQRGLRPYGSTHGMRPKVYVVHGAPCSGKKDYVAKHLGENDVVFDYDEVMAAVSGRPIYEPNRNLVSYCLDIRTLILKKALQRSGADKTWIITTRVGDDMKSQLSDIPVKYVHIDTPKDECLQRLKQDEKRQPLAQELRQVIEEYFKTGDEEQRRAPLAQPGVERRYIGNFGNDERLDPELLRIEKRSDPETGKPRTYIIGYAARFHRDSLLLGDFVEQIDPGAFEIVTNRQDEDGKPLETRCLFNHDPNHLLGRFPTTMRMVVDDKGLRYECLLPETRSDLEELIARGDLKGSSFSFVVSEGGERWTTENGQSRRIVTKVKAILDCGPVTYPAYSDSSVSVAKRSYEQFVGKPQRKPRRKSRLKTLERRAESLRARIAAEAFLAERRDCGREQDGKFGSENKCQDGAGGASGSSASLDQNKVSAQVASVSGIGRTWKVNTQKDGSVHINGAAGEITVSKNAPAHGVKGKSNLHFNPSGGGKEIAKLATDAAKATGSETVSVQSWSPEHDEALKANGFKKTGGAFTKSEDHDIWVKDLTKEKKSSRSERRDCGRGDDGKFGSGNKCQEDESSSSEPKSGNRPQGSKAEKAAAEQRPPVGEESPKYMELSRPMTSGKAKAAQKFADAARKRQEAKTKEKSTDAGDDGSGVQTWSKGDAYPWTAKQVGDSSKGGYVQAQHPDGTKTKKYEFPAGSDGSDAYRKAEDEIKQKKKRSLSIKAAELRSFLEARR